MFNTGSRLTEIMKSKLELADLEEELADSSANSYADPAKIGVWVRAFSPLIKDPTSAISKQYNYFNIRILLTFLSHSSQA